MDGRKLPTGETLDNMGPSWYGVSVAEWQGDTLVVNTSGFEQKAWPDQYANPLSFDARIEERYRRIDANTIEGRMTIYDPKNYTAPWAHEPALFRRMKPEHVTFFGWTGLFSGVTETICAPINESDFAKDIRDPAIFGDDR
jgi:hypothetical protein